MTPREFLDYLGQLHNLSASERTRKIRDLLDLVHLADAGKRRIGGFSRGMRQRLGIAELLIKEARVAFLDEPTLGLDPDGTLRIMELIQGLARDRGMTIVLSSHQLNQVEKICHRVGIMIKGRMVAQGPMEQLAREKFGLGSEQFTLEEIYMKYFLEA
jgi:ABC-2 type transport system ATP-binding protein